MHFTPIIGSQIRFEIHTINKIIKSIKKKEEKSKTEKKSDGEGICVNRSIGVKNQDKSFKLKEL
jgi:hypothetical protein